MSGKGLELRKVFVKTYGCQMNVYDSERMTETLLASRATWRPKARNPPISSCSTPATSARRRPRRSIPSSAGCAGSRKRGAEAGRRVMIGVAGCVAQAEGAEILRRAPTVDLVVGPQSYHRLPEILAEAAARRRVRSPPISPVEENSRRSTARSPARAARGVAAFLTVQEGCDKFCTFCVVPYTRGAEVSRPAAAIVAEAARLAGSRGARDHAPRPERQRLAWRGSRRRALGPRPAPRPPRRNPRARPAPLRHQPPVRHG